MKTIIRILGIAGASLIGLAACGGSSAVSGRYVAEVREGGMEMNMELDFQKDGKATLTMVEGDNRQDMDCTYETGERRISVNCFGSSGISLTRLDDGDLEGDMDGMIVRYEKR
jgi:hypothetical protein